jgi:hypothetical protein
MAFDWGGGLGGGLSGAAAGMGAFGPVGAAVGGIAGLLGGGISGGGPAEYEPSPLQEALAGYGFDQVKASPSLRRSIKKQFSSLKQGGNLGAAEAFLEAYRGRFSNPEFIEKRLAKSYGKPIDYSSGGFGDIAKSVYGSQGLGFTEEDYGNFASEAKALGIRSPQAFGDMLKRKLISEGKVATPAQEQLSYFWGPSGRDASGRLTNKYGAGVNIDYSMKNAVV